MSAGFPASRAIAPRSPAGLPSLLAPVTAATFLEAYWEKQPLIVHRDDPGRYADLFTLADLDAILAATGLRDGDLRVLMDGRQVAFGAGPQTDTDDARSEPHAPGLETIYEHYRKGATLNLTRLHERWVPLGRLCRDLAAELSAAVQTNVYLTPAGAQGLSEHFDTHDVFVVQVHGSKRWRLYDSPAALPMGDERYTRPPAGPGEPVKEFTLGPGDLMYLPRGVVHAATSQDEASLHLTIGVIPVRWADLVRAAIETVFAADVRYRRALPVGFAADPALQEQAQSRVAELVAALAGAEIPADLVTSFARTASPPALDGHLLDLEAARSIGPDTPVRRRPDLTWRLHPEREAARLEFHGKVLTFPARVVGELQYVGRCDPFTARDLPGGLDEPGRMVLIGTLLREGFLTLP
jgi:ribosomal protein L16 Arg81 hydroxylase